jgi:hypothetical protein
VTNLYLDTETMGLSLTEHDIWEIAYAFDDEPVQAGTVWHRRDWRHYDEVALEINGYRDRVLPREKVDPNFEDDFIARLREHKQAGHPVTIVGANPWFDMTRLSRRWMWEEPWHYRAIDVENFAAGFLGWPVPRNLRSTAAAVRDLGYAVPEPDHTAAGDVETARAVYKGIVSEMDAVRAFQAEATI